MLSFLFNWPSTGGGIVHTLELVRFLGRAGYQVRHYYARQPAWGVGQVQGDLPIPSQALEFGQHDWTAAAICARYREAIDAFDPDYVIITDAWSFKARLAQAAGGRPYLLRQQAMECLCPLNNLRLLVDREGRIQQCPAHQFADPRRCAECLRSRGGQAGSLHQAERALSGVGSPEYDDMLRRAFAQAKAVLVVNPLQQAMLEPFAKDVRVVTYGMDRARFPWPRPHAPRCAADGRARLVMAGLAHELIKGYHVLDEACRQLWRKRQDFQLLVTSDPPGRTSEFTEFLGWLSQEELPELLSACDILIAPTIAQDGLARTTVEAMGVGRPVIASRIGGLPYSVADGLTGLLCEPGDAADLAEKIETLLDHPDLRTSMGLAGRARFERDFFWETVIDRHYKPLLAARRLAGAQRGRPPTRPSKESWP